MKAAIVHVGTTVAITMVEAIAITVTIGTISDTTGAPERSRAATCHLQERVASGFMIGRRDISLLRQTAAKPDILLIVSEVRSYVAGGGASCT